MAYNNKRKRSEDGETGATPGKKYIQRSGDLSFVFGIENETGSLQQALGIFSKHKVNLTRLESRPSVTNENGYEFFASTDSSGDELSSCLDELKATAKNLTVLDEDPSTDNGTWFPRNIRELDTFADRVLNLGDTLESDHPGANDPVYRARRKYFADIAIKYRHGKPIPRVTYDAEETKTWQTVYTTLRDLYTTHACEEFNKAFPLLEMNCGYAADNIPQLEDISNFLHRVSGFRLRPVAGLLTSRDFLAGLAFRVFHSTQYIRHSKTPLYTPEPDVCHELLGHVPLFANKEFAEFSQEIGLASLGASDADVTRLATLYWFTIEFGICREKGQLKAYGAGLLSSFGELQYCLSDKPSEGQDGKLKDPPKYKAFEPPTTCLQEYPVTDYQPVYFITESFEQAKKQMRDFANTLEKSFQIRYNPYTETIETVETADDLHRVANGIRCELSLLCDALAKKSGKSTTA